MIFEETIAAIATPAGKGGVAIIRLSGKDPLAIAEKMFKPTGKTLEDVLAMKALNAFTWQPPKDKEERKRLLEIIKKGKIDHIITGGPKQ